MIWAVHSWHVPATLVDEADTMSHDGVTRVRLPAPLFTAETREEAEAWRGDARRVAGEGSAA